MRSGKFQQISNITAYTCPEEKLAFDTHESGYQVPEESGPLRLLVYAGEEVHQHSLICSNR